MTRDSLVANMLLSLDQFSLAQKQDHGPFSPGTDLAGSTPYDADERNEYRGTTFNKEENFPASPSLVYCQIDRLPRRQLRRSRSAL